MSNDHLRLRPAARARGFMTCSTNRTIFPVLLMTFTAFLLLTLTSFSLPMSRSLYFLHSSQAGGVRFGIWGWCLQEYDVCIDTLKLGYTWEPQISIPVTRALVLHPVATVLTLFSLIALVPVSCYRSPRTDRVFAIFISLSLVVSFFAFLFTIGMWGVAKARFEKAGFQARFGPLPWMSLFATILLLIVTGYSIWGSSSDYEQKNDLGYQGGKGRRGSKYY